MAPIFIAIKKARRSIITELVFKINIRSAKSTHINILTGITVVGSLMPTGKSTVKASNPIINNGAVSPGAFVMPMIVPFKYQEAQVVLHDGK